MLLSWSNFNMTNKPYGNACFNLLNITVILQLAGSNQNTPTFFYFCIYMDFFFKMASWEKITAEISLTPYIWIISFLLFQRKPRLFHSLVPGMKSMITLTVRLYPAENWTNIKTVVLIVADERLSLCFSSGRGNSKETTRGGGESPQRESRKR